MNALCEGNKQNVPNIKAECGDGLNLSTDIRAFFVPLASNFFQCRSYRNNFISFKCLQVSISLSISEFI